MKKLIAAMLMISLCVTTAFAFDFTPGSKIEIDASDKQVWGEQVLDYEISTTNYSIAGQSWETGKDLISSITIDNEDNLFVIKLKPDYSMSKDKELRGTVKVRDKKQGRFLTMTINCTIGFNRQSIDIQPDGSISPVTVDQDTLYTVTATDKGYPYGTLLFQADVADVEVRVYDKEKFYLGYNREPDKDTLLANAESDALIEFLNFEGAPTFSGTATVTFYGFEDNHHIYELKNGRLVKTNAKWDNESDSFVLKTRTLGNYVISDKTLRSASGTVEDDEVDDDMDQVNPDTGANDVVGIATALAIVSMASAAALSLKKNRE